MKHFFLFPLFALGTFLPAQTIFHVDQNATGNASGSSWAHAFPLLQQALALAQNGDEIWVAAGVYKPTHTTDRHAHYDLPSGVAVYGGFSGSETLREQRDWAAHPSILSGDIGVLGDSTDNSFNILYSYSPNDKTRLDGLIFEEGNATNPDPAAEAHRPTRSGAGVYVDGELFGYAELSVANCTFRRNRAQYQGGGLYANGREEGMAIVRLENCVFEYNVSHTQGGAFALENYSDQPFPLDVKGCVFRGNFSFATGNAIWLRAHQPVNFSDCTFSENTSNGGMTIFFTQLQSAHPVAFTSCSFFRNSDYVIFYYPNGNATGDSRLDFRSCVFTENHLPVARLYSPNKMFANFEQCIFNSNQNTLSSLFYVGDMIIIISESSKPKATFTNSLFYNNIAWEVRVPLAEVNNCIIIDPYRQVLPAQDFFRGDSCWLSNTLSNVGSCDSLGKQYEANILCDSTNLFGVDPMFVNPSLSDFHLQNCSPALNAGANALLDALGISTDFDGNPRIRNAVVDMGPYERHISLHPTVSALPTCAGEKDGAIALGPDICAPFTFLWNNGTTTGTHTDGLAAGTYVFTATGTNNIPVFDTLILSEPAPLNVTLQTQNVHCHGQASGFAESSVSGGTAPFSYHWDPPLPPVATHFNLPPGDYSLTVTDADGCTGSAQASIGSPDPIQYFYTLQNTSCMGCNDGSIVFDSVTGGTNPPLPAPMLQLSAGVYCLTLTDAAGCSELLCITVSTASDTDEKLLQTSWDLHPNPSVRGQNVHLQWFMNSPALVQVLDVQGKILLEKPLAPHSTLPIVSQWPSGVYQVRIQTAKGQRSVKQWVIF